MTYASLRSHTLRSTLGFALLLAVAGCSGLDDPGGDEPTAGETADPDPDDGESGEPDPDDGESGEDGADGSEPVDCAIDQLELAIDEPGPSGVSGKELLALIGEEHHGEIDFAGFPTAKVRVEVSPREGSVAVVHSDDATEGCSAFTLTEVPVELLLRSDDGKLDELVEATLVHHSADPESAAASVRIDFAELGGKLEAPETIGDEELPLADFERLELDLQLVLGAPRTMITIGEQVLEEVHGVLLGVGHLAEWSCDSEPGAACQGGTREYFVGSLVLKH